MLPWGHRLLLTVCDFAWQPVSTMLTLCSHLQNMALVKAVEDRAAQKGCTPGQLALAWVLARGDDVIPIPGTKRPNCFDENLAALKVKLTPEECTELENAVPHHEVRMISPSRKSYSTFGVQPGCLWLGNLDNARPLQDA